MHIHTSGIILRRFNYSDADQILTLLTPDLGKVDILAKGCRRIKSRFCGRVEFFYEVEFSAYSGRSFYYLDDIDLKNHRNILDLPPESKNLLFYLAEVTHKLIQSDQQVDGIYDLLSETIYTISQHPDKQILAFHAYLIKTLTLLGFLGSWNKCAHSDKKLDLTKNFYHSISDGNLIADTLATPDDIHLRTPLIKWVNYMQQYPLSDVVKVSIDTNEEQATWGIIDRTIKNILNKPLNSEAFL